MLPIGLTACGQAVAVPARTAKTAPEGAYAVGVRTLTLNRGTARPLPVTIWYPTERRVPGSVGSARADVSAAGTPYGATAGKAADTRDARDSRGGTGPPTRDTPVATGRFPLVLFSHGLHSLPEYHAQLTTRLAAAGFVVAAPAYPHTNRRTARFNRADVRNQPADAWQVIREVIRLDTARGDPLAGHLDATRIAAAGHSAGGFTTAGLFTAGHSEQLRAGIVIAGGGMAGAFAGPPAAMLFVHGGADPTVPAATGRAAYDRVPWPKAFLTLPGQGHGEYLTPGRPGFDQAMAAMIEFLRWTLYGDPDARRRIPAGASRPGVTEFTDRLGGGPRPVVGTHAPAG